MNAPLSGKLVYGHSFAITERERTTFPGPYGPKEESTATTASSDHLGMGDLARCIVCTVGEACGLEAGSESEKDVVVVV